VIAFFSLFFFPDEKEPTIKEVPAGKNRRLMKIIMVVGYLYSGDLQRDFLRPVGTVKIRSSFFPCIYGFFFFNLTHLLKGQCSSGSEPPGSNA